MAWTRTLVAALVAVSIAVLPVAGTAAQAGAEQASAEMSAAVPDHDCCPTEPSPCGNGMFDCPFAGCALKSLTFLATPLLRVALSTADPAVLLPPASAALQTRTVGPPFRPPRS